MTSNVLSVNAGTKLSGTTVGFAFKTAAETSSSSVSSSEIQLKEGKIENKMSGIIQRTKERRKEGSRRRRDEGTRGRRYKGTQGRSDEETSDEGTKGKRGEERTKSRAEERKYWRIISWTLRATQAGLNLTLRP